MAHLCSCDICNEKLINAYRCEDCEKAVLEDLIYRIQFCLKGKDPLPKTLVNEIREMKVQSLEQHKKKREKAKFADLQRSSRRQIHGLARLEATQKAGREFDRKHPDPNPITYGGFRPK